MTREEKIIATAFTGKMFIDGSDMKKILTIIFAILLFASCTNGVNYRVSVKKGDIRKTYTEEYVLTETCIGESGFGIPLWKKVSVIPRDTISVESYERQ